MSVPHNPYVLIVKTEKNSPAALTNPALSASYSDILTGDVAAVRPTEVERICGGGDWTLLEPAPVGTG